jgi:hypothetical protein
VLSLHVTEEGDLFALFVELHEGLFEISEMRFDHERSMLVLPFRRCERDEARVVTKTRWKTTWEAPWRSYLLQIATAVDCEVNDIAETGGFWPEQFTYDRDSRTVRIEGVPPVEITVRVERLEISVDGTQEIIGLGRYETSWGGRETGPVEVLPLQ